MHAWSTSMLLLLHSAFVLSVVKMLKGEVGGRALNTHGNYIVDHGKSWKNNGIVFLNFCGNPVLARRHFKTVCCHGPCHWCVLHHTSYIYWVHPFWVNIGRRLRVGEKRKKLTELALSTLGIARQHVIEISELWVFHLVIITCLILILFYSRFGLKRGYRNMCWSRGGDSGSGPPPLKNHKNIGFLSNTGPGPL